MTISSLVQTRFSLNLRTSVNYKLRVKQSRPKMFFISEKSKAFDIQIRLDLNLGNYRAFKKNSKVIVTFLRRK